MLPSFKIWGEIIYLYPFLLGIAWVLAFKISHSLNIEVKKLNGLLFALFVSSWLGAKLFFIITSEYIDKTKFLTSSNFWLGGGFVFYGGLIFGLIALIIFSKLTDQNLKRFYFLVIPLTLSHGIGRVGCFLAGCCHGSFFLPVQLLEATGLFTISFIAYRKFLRSNRLLPFYLICYSVLRFILEYIRNDEIRGVYLGLSTSQIISLVLLTIGIIVSYRDRASRMTHN